MLSTYTDGLLAICRQARRVTRLLAAVGLACVCVVLTSVPAIAAEKAIWGPVTLPDGSSPFGLYDELSIDTVQLAVNWALVAPRQPAAPRNPADPAYAWPPEISTAVAEAAAHGMRVALLVKDAPPWANGGRSPIWAPTRASDYADFVAAAARRYPSVRRWMIWGEPNKVDHFQPSAENAPTASRAYARVLDAAYGALKAASSSNRVIGGMTWTSGDIKPTDFVRWMRLPDGRRPRLDWFGHNPFPFRFPRLSDAPIDGGIRDISDTDTFSADVSRAYGRRIPLWLSEFTVQTDHGSNVFATFVSHAAQGRYVTAAFQLADDLAGRVSGLGWFGLVDEAPAATSANWGLLTYGLERKPSFAALARAPSERLAPRVRAATSASVSSLRGRGLAVTVVPRSSGPLVVELRRGGRRVARLRAQGVAGRSHSVRLRFSAALRGPHTLAVRAARAATVRRALRVR